MRVHTRNEKNHPERKLLEISATEETHADHLQKIQLKDERGEPAKRLASFARWHGKRHELALNACDQSH